MNWLRRFHRNTGGAISVLVLLTIWCLVALVAMIWNTGEYAMRRRHLQNAADSDAHSAATWMSRTTNQITLQNMVIAQNGATDVIARALAPTHTILFNKITGEMRAVDGLPQQLAQEAATLDQVVRNIRTQYALVSTALDEIDADLQNGTLIFPNKKAADDYRNKVRQARYAVNWIENNYVPQLSSLVAQLDAQVEEIFILHWPIMKGMIDRWMQDELDVLQQYWNKVVVDTGPEVQETLAANESQIFQEQGDVTEALPNTVENQRSDFENFYHANIAHTDVSAPVMPAIKVVPEIGLAHTDSIRAKYSIELGLPETVDIDPINPNTALPGDPALGSEVVYPNPIALIGGQFIAINCNVPHGWGHCWAFPIERYFSDRVAKDMTGLQTEFFRNGSTGIDDLRIQLAQAWDEMFGVSRNAPAVPASVTDDQVNPTTGRPDIISLFPSLANSGATGTNTDADFAYSRSVAQYLASLQQLVNNIHTFGGFVDEWTVPIAVPTWQAQIRASHFIVSQEIGQGKDFMVLKSYKLHKIPEWAQPGMQESLTTAITWEIYQRNLNKLAPFGLVALSAIRPYASEIAAELVSRPWPYEKTPPGDDELVPPTRGIEMQDRHDFFSVFTAASETDATSVRVLLPAIFGKNPTKLAAYAQAETFNWMEYNDSYGGYATEKFDEVSTNVFDTMLACPRAWRLSTIGGWNWQPRLSAADNLANAILGDPKSDIEIKKQPNPEIQSALDNAGIHISSDNSDNRNALDLINLH